MKAQAAPHASIFAEQKFAKMGLEKDLIRISLLVFYLISTITIHGGGSCFQHLYSQYLLREWSGYELDASERILRQFLSEILASGSFSQSKL